ncbi:MAG: hypothetical protein AAFW89_09115 [Bacteroidota bacterium]
MSKAEFYIGWEERMPSRHKRFFSVLIPLLLMAIPILVFGLVVLQEPFNDHQFEFGTLTELSGIYHQEPFPMLEVSSGVPDGFSRQVLLVGFGKSGATASIDAIEQTHGALINKQVTFKGTLLYGDGITLFELTDQEDSFVAVSEPDSANKLNPSVPEEKMLIGELIDPKCYFGVMKPGLGKAHRSCAVRCVSGGIPPVLKVDDPYSESDRYVIVKGLNGKKINADLLPYIGDHIMVNGSIYTQNGWDVIHIDTSLITRLYKKRRPGFNADVYYASSDDMCVYPPLPK